MSKLKLQKKDWHVLKHFDLTNFNMESTRTKVPDRPIPEDKIGVFSREIKKKIFTSTTMKNRSTVTRIKCTTMTNIVK